jgi:hypothetical protein
VDTLEDRRDRLYERLEVGYGRIERALADGGDVTPWEDFWLELLKEYEQVCDEIQGVPPKQVELFVAPAQ